jgi:hypothetical protein
MDTARERWRHEDRARRIAGVPPSWGFRTEAGRFADVLEWRAAVRKRLLAFRHPRLSFDEHWAAFMKFARRNQAALR